MNAITINLSAIRKHLQEILKVEKKNGIKKAWYFYHVNANQVQAIDTLKEYKDFVKVYENQAIMPYKTIDVLKSTSKKYGVNSVKLHVFRKEGSILQRANDSNGNFFVDQIGCAFDYMPADCETCIAEVIFVK